MLERGRSSENKENPKRIKIERKRAKLMRKLKMAKIELKRSQIRFYNVRGIWVMVEPTSVNARGSVRTRS